MIKDKLKFLQNKKIALLGLGAENLALAKFMLRHSPAAEQTPSSPPLRKGRDSFARRGNFTTLPRGEYNITVCDPKSAAELGDRFLEIKELARKNKLPEITLMTGKNYDAHLADFDIVFRSPGYPLFSKNLAKAAKVGVEISSAMKLFFALCPTKNIIGVTGSKGKGTTASLIYEIISAALKNMTHPVSRGAIHPSREGTLRKVFLGGNIGTAPFEFIDKIKPGDFAVLELSSFQLEDLGMSPHVAVITNIYEEHLAPADPNNPNYHKSMKDYRAAKANIFAHQGKNDYLIINEKLKSNLSLRAKRSNPDFAARSGIASSLRGVAPRNDKNIIFYSKSDLPNKLIGGHNQENVAAAAAVAKIFKVKDETIAKAVKKFQGLPHRLEFVAEINGVKYFDDSFATVPDVSVIALKSFGDLNNTPRRRGGATPLERGIILLAGGADKGSDFKNFVKEIKKQVKLLILFKGKGSEKIKAKLPAASCQLPVKEAGSMKEAMFAAKKVAKPGDIVLLSTGCASFGCFKNYKERGELFKEEVLKK